jgi:hypothetical protein
VNKHNDAAAGLDETLGIAAALDASVSGPCQVLFYARATMVSAAAWEFRRFGPLNLRIEGCQGGVNIAAIERSVCGAKRGDHRVELQGAIHLRVHIYLEPPCTNPYARWCGRGQRATAAPMPILPTIRELSRFVQHRLAK